MPFHGPRGPFRAAGLLITRSCFELTALQAAEQETFYANTDCVMTAPGAPLGVWDAFQMRYRRVAAGEAHVVALGVYRCGEKATRCYDPSLRLQGARIVMPLPSRLYVSEWLA